MKLHLAQDRSVRSSVLLITMAATLILGLGAASYLTLMSWQRNSVIRSQAWNAAMGLAEAGVEEALAQLNPSALLFNTNIDRGANGWELWDDGMYHAPRRTLPDGDYDVAITADVSPIICATGYVRIPTFSATTTRAVRVAAATTSLFRGSMAARVNIDFNGNYISIDSFDSSDWRYSTNGLYDPLKRKANGDVASTGGVIAVQNADVMGTLYTGANASYTVGAQGSVGDLAWVLGGTNGLQAGHWKNDFNLDFPDVLPPYDHGVSPIAKTVNGTNYNWVLENDCYMWTDIKGATFKTGEKILVTGQATLYVTGEFIMQGGASLTIAKNASLSLYVGGANTILTTVNNAGTCRNFSYFGLPGNTAVTLTGNDLFLGSIYAPNANLSMSGGGKNTLDYQGACAVKTIWMNGHFNFHFDEDLRRTGPVRGYQVASWREI